MTYAFLSFVLFAVVGTLVICGDSDGDYWYAFTIATVSMFILIYMGVRS